MCQDPALLLLQQEIGRAELGSNTRFVFAITKQARSPPRAFEHCAVPKTRLSGGRRGQTRPVTGQPGRPPSYGELFSILLEQQLIASGEVSFLEGLLASIKREDLVSQLKHFVEEGEANAPDDQPDVHEKRLLKAAFEVICENVGRDWKIVMRKLGFSEVKMDRVVAANPFNLREQLAQSLREWQKWKGRDAKVTDLIKALRGCNMNLVADRVEQKLLSLNTGTR
ncbi:PREDICTED: FAS-associated death domain protein [Aptenodytes forsteri]|uniref:FAS-associated death domain protein n=1 Tax=Aptenodytes forsteri TaxID=9233 RepID=UPI000905A582|nr:PREDICTED: FAS-associated death domain protein [Aptenodytes forsteri]